MDPSDDSVLPLTELSSDILHDTFAALPWSTLQQMLLSSRHLSAQVQRAISNPYFWRKRVARFAGASYTGPHPMTLAILLEHLKAYSLATPRNFDNYITQLLVGINIPEFITFFVATGFGYGITPATIYHNILSDTNTTPLADKTILLQAVLNIKNDHDWKLLMSCISISDLKVYVIPHLEGELLGRVEALVEKWIKEDDDYRDPNWLLDINFVNHEALSETVVRNAEVLQPSPEYLLGYANNAAATEVILRSRTPVIYESVRVAYLKGLGELMLQLLRISTTGMV